MDGFTSSAVQNNTIYLVNLENLLWIDPFTFPPFVCFDNHCSYTLHICMQEKSNVSIGHIWKLFNWLAYKRFNYTKHCPPHNCQEQSFINAVSDSQRNCIHGRLQRELDFGCYIQNSLTDWHTSSLINFQCWNLVQVMVWCLQAPEPDLCRHMASSNFNELTWS